MLVLSKRQLYEEDFFKFCDFLTISYVHNFKDIDGRFQYVFILYVQNNYELRKY